MPKKGDRPVGYAEIAEELGVAVKTVYAWRDRGLLPPVDWPTAEAPLTVNGRHAWWLTTIRQWYAQRARAGVGGGRRE